MIRSVLGSRNTSSVRCQCSAGTSASPWRRSARLRTKNTTSTITAMVQATTAASARRRPDDDGGSVGHDLGEALADLRGVEPHPDDGVAAEQPRVLDHPVHRVPPAVLEQLRVLGDLAALQRFEARPDPLRDAHAPHDEAEARSELSFDLHAGDLERGADP